MTREELRDYVETQRSLNNIPYHVYTTLIDGIDTLEQDSRKAHWITKPHVYGVTYCSECDFELKINDTKYCPNCGCRMVEPQESEEKE